MELDAAIGIIQEIGWIVLGSIGLLFAVLAFRNRVKPGAARRMGVPAIIFTWMGFIYWLVLFEGAYGLVGMLLDLPLWVDIVFFLVILGLSITIYSILLRRKKFNSEWFRAIFLIPLTIPGVHTAARLVPKAIPTPVVKVESPAPGVRFPRQEAVAGSGYRVEFENTHSKGRLGDHLTARRLTAKSYTKMVSKLNRLHGIDGVYVRFDGKGNPREILIVENKVDFARLAPDQMTDRWVTERVDAMLAHPKNDVRRTGELIRDNRSVVRKELHHHDLGSGKTTISSVDAEGRTSRVRTESFLAEQVRKLCEAKKPRLVCTPVGN